MTKPVKVLFTGLSIIDIQMFVEAYPKPNTKTRTDKYEITTGGPATNAAITCAFLGGNTTLVSPVGKHYFSHSILDSIHEHKVKLIDPISETESDPLIASIITDERNGERTIFSFNPPTVNFEFIPEKHIRLSEYSIALFDGFYTELSVEIAKKLKKLGIPTVLDGGSWKSGLEVLLPYIDMAICSSDFYPPGTNSETDVLDYLRKFAIEKIAITRGDRPILKSEDSKNEEIPVQKVICKDSLGAGDVIHGAFCYFYAQGNNFEKSLSEASKIASYSCMYRGTRLWMKHFKNELKNKK